MGNYEWAINPNINVNFQTIVDRFTSKVKRYFSFNKLLHFDDDYVLLECSKLDRVFNISIELC